MYCGLHRSLGIIKSNAIPVTGCGDLYSCERLRVPHYLDSRLMDGSEVVRLAHQLCSTPQKHFLILVPVRCWVNPRAIAWLEVENCKNAVTSLGLESMTFRLGAIAPQPTKVQHAPPFSNITTEKSKGYVIRLGEMCNEYKTLTQKHLERLGKIW
jgi:hypothetical protein